MDETEEGKVPHLAGMDVRIMMLFFAVRCLRATKVEGAAKSAK